MAGITSTKKIKGQPHLLAYITPNEVEKLKALGGQETMTKEGIPAYPPEGNYGSEGKGAGSGPGKSGISGMGVGGGDHVQSGGTGQTSGPDRSRISIEQQINHERATGNKERARKDAYREQQLKAARKLTGNQTFSDVFSDVYQYGKKAPSKFRTLSLKNLIDQKMKNKTGYPGFLSMANVFNPSMVDEDYTYNSAPTTDMLGVNIQDYMDTEYGLTGKNMTDIDRINRALDQGRKTGNISQKEFEAAFFGDKGPPDFTGGGGGDGLQPYLPIDYNTGAALPTEEEVVEDKTFDYRFGTGQNVGADVLRGYVANGGRITRAGGGIMNAVPRQGYFLGGIGKAIGKAVGSVAKAAGKVLSSDVGKMALAAGAFYYGGGGGNPFTAAGRAKFSAPSFFSKSNPLLFSANKAGEQVFNPLKFAGLITAGGALAGPAKVDQMPGGSERGGRLKDSQGNEVLPAGIRAEIDEAYESGDVGRIKEIESYYAFLPPRNQYLPYPNYAVGGRVAAQEGGLMNLGGMEKDYRAEGGFVPIGKAEKADDVPARLSVNEFVFTADAVRNAGGGDIDKGAEVMENMMKNLENGGRVSEESQGNAGAQQMFSVSERIGEVI